MNNVAVDLFCGIGGLTYGLKSAGINVVAGIDYDGSCKYAYESNNKAKFIGKSVSDVTGEEIQELWGKNDSVKILVGCAPCQPFSHHQKDKKNRKRHKDWGLLYEFLRIVEESEPDIVSMENVPNLENEQVFKDFVDGLKELGYQVEYKVHNAEEVGVPQRRLRLLLLASKSGNINFCKKKYRRKTVRRAIGHLPSIEAGNYENQIDPLHVSSALSDINLKRIGQSVPGGTWKDWDDELLPECYKKKSGATYTSVYGRMNWDGSAPTLTTQFNGYGTGRFGHPEQNRALSLREGALLQSFPAKYKFVKRNEKFRIGTIARQIGNAVPPKLGEHIGNSIMEKLAKEDITCKK